MAQHDFQIDNQTAPLFRADLNNALTALVTQSSGATEPATTYAYMLWYDTTADILKMRKEANDGWINIGSFNHTTGVFTSSGVVGLTQVQVENAASTIMGLVSGQRLAQAVDANVDYALGNAALAAGGVGTYVFGGAEVNLELGDTVAGSSLAPVGLYSSGGYTRTLGSPLTGTWRCMGKNTTDGSRPATLYLRIS